MKIKRYIEKNESREKGIEWTLWLYGFMALLRRVKYIFIILKKILKASLVQIFQRKKKYFVPINFVEENYLYTTASGNSEYVGL